MTTKKFPYLIAEVGVNHNGSLPIALELIDIAADAGVDAVKFQIFTAASLVSRSAPKAEYQIQNTNASETQFDMLHRLELTKPDIEVLINRCRQKGVAFLATPFDSASLELLCVSFGAQVIKISSGDLTNAPFLLDIGRRVKKIILSTGMSSLAEIEGALGVLAFALTADLNETPSMEGFSRAYSSDIGQVALRNAVTLLHCTTEYPTPMEEVNLRAMDALHASFGLPVGYSDHTKGIHIPVAAVARGAVMIEKHFTLDKSYPGPDHKASIDPVELEAMVKAIRDIQVALGDGIKRPTLSEVKNSSVARKSLVAAESMKCGDPLNIAVKRPGTGISPYRYWDLQGRPAGRDYQADELIDDGI